MFSMCHRVQIGAHAVCERQATDAWLIWMAVLRKRWCPCLFDNQDVDCPGLGLNLRLVVKVDHRQLFVNSDLLCVPLRGLSRSKFCMPQFWVNSISCFSAMMPNDGIRKHRFFKARFWWLRQWFRSFTHMECNIESTTTDLIWFGMLRLSHERSVQKACGFICIWQADPAHWAKLAAAAAAAAAARPANSDPKASRHAARQCWRCSSRLFPWYASLSGWSAAKIDLHECAVPSGKVKAIHSLTTAWNEMTCTAALPALELENLLEIPFRQAENRVKTLEPKNLWPSPLWPG